MSLKRLLAVGASVVVAASLGLLAWAWWPLRPLPVGVRADHVVVTKSKRRLELLQGGRVIATYTVSLGRAPMGAKQREGDDRTPEGHYTIDAHVPDSSYFRALHVSYPSAADRARARAQGVAPGGDIMVHGIPHSGPS